MTRIVAESDLAGTTKSEYVFFNGERIARRDGVNGTGEVFYYFSDHLGTASVITDGASNIKAESDYYPWGGELQFTNDDSNHYKFTGKERDIETGLDYFGARYYSNGLGRWVSADWAAKATGVPYANFSDPQSLNLDSMVENNPLRQADVDGHELGYQYGPNGMTAPTEAGSQPASEYEKGGTQIALGIGLIATAAGGDIPGGGLGALLITNALLGGTATTVNGVTQIMGAATQTDTSEAREALSATSTLPGLATAAATGGNLKAAGVVSTVTNAATLATAPNDAVKNPATAVDAVKTVQETTGLVQSAINTVTR